MDISRIDLNLLPILTALLEHKNTQIVAQRLQKSQPAISRGLSKLREQLGDELFARTAHGLEPTAYARELSARLPQALTGLTNALQPEEFDPRKLKEKISIVSISTVIEPYGANILRALQEQAPNCDIEITAWCSHVEQRLLEGEYTIGVNNLVPQRTQQLTQRVVKNLKLIMACRHEYPYRGDIAHENFFQYPTIALRIPGWNETRVRYLEALKRNKIDYQQAFTTDNINLAMEMVRSSDVTIGLSRSLAERMGDFRILPIPGELEVIGQIAVTMRTTHRMDPKYLWLTESGNKSIRKSPQ